MKTRFICIIFAIIYIFHNLSAEAAPLKRRIIRVRFAAVSESNRTEGALNDNLQSAKSTASYDAVWEAEADGDDFPTAFPDPIVNSATGYNTVITKDGMHNCNNALMLDSTRLPAVLPYNFSDDKVAVIIATPHFSKNNKVQATISNPAVDLGCGTPIYFYFGNTDKTETVEYDTGTTTTTVEPAMFDLPPSPGTTSPIQRGDYAVFQVSRKNPETSISYKFEQRTTTQQTENTIRWRGFVSVEVNPKKDPPPTDPNTFLQRDPPYVPSEPSKPVEIDEKLPPLIEKMFENITIVIKTKGKEIEPPANSENVTITNPDGSQTTLNSSTNVVTTTTTDNVPQTVSVTGTFSVKNAGADKASESKIKAFTLTAGSPPLVNLKLPNPLVKALTKGLASKVSITFIVKAAGVKKPLKKSTSFKLTKRPKAK